MWAKRYILDRTLGEGGMGRILLASDTEKKGDKNGEHRQVAIKIPLPECRGNEEKFRAEYERLRSFRHTGIPAAYEFGMHEHERGGTIPFFTMEYCRGYHIHLFCPRGIPLHRFIRWMIRVCEAMEHTHSLGWLHRDFKPQNVIADDVRDQVKVIDFGISTRIGDPPDSEFTGTPEYTSPEVLGGYMFDERADLYSFGLVLYEVIEKGRRPWSGSYEEDLLDKRIKTLPPPIENPACPKDIKDLVFQLLRPSPRDRPRSATEVRERLESALKHME